MQETLVRFLGWEFPWRRNRLPTPILGLPWWLRRLFLECKRPGFDPWVGKMPWRRHPGCHSSILAWRIPMDRGAWWATVHVVTELDVTKYSTHANDGFYFSYYYYHDQTERPIISI